MRFYQKRAAPNPRRARFFMAEKGVDFDAIEFVELDLDAGDNRAESFARKNPMRSVPVLELDDGTAISESVAISRYFEALAPKPLLMGRDPLDQATIEMWQRRMEFELFLPVTLAFRHTSGHFADRETVCGEWGEICRERARAMFDFLNAHLAANEFIAGSAFTIADITAVCAIDFARVVKLRVSDEQPHLQRWHAMISARPAAAA